MSGSPTDRAGLLCGSLGQAASLRQPQDERHMAEGPALPAPNLSGPHAAARPGKPSGDGALHSCARVSVWFSRGETPRKCWLA